MRPTRLTVSSQDVSAPIPVDMYADPFAIGIGVDMTGATLTYSVEHTFDDVWATGFSAASATWYPNSGLTAQTSSGDGNYAYPITAVRLNVTAYTSGSATMTVIQAG